MQTDCPSLADQGGLTKVSGLTGWLAGWLASGLWARTGRGFCKEAEAVSRLGTVQYAGGEGGGGAGGAGSGGSLRLSESIVTKSGHANGCSSRGSGSQESIRKRRAGLADETGRAAGPGSQEPWGC